ncbi:prominin-like protein isoform X2 [Eurosta solidaginis]|uniref:prominin-like protein isoform X2 n=1 Tax=Eurosta solidaginis TaxID=178769 RepID=UPI0035309383
MNSCTSGNETKLATRTSGDDHFNDRLIDHFMDDFATKDIDYDNDKGRIFILFIVGILTIVLVVLVFLTCLIYACLRCRRRCKPYRWRCEKKCQKGCRWFFAIVMLLLIPLIIYLLLLYILAVLRNTYNERNNAKNDGSKQRSIESTLIDEYSNIYRSAFDSVDVGRVFFRNITTFVTQTKKGTKFYKTLNLADKDTNWTPIFSLIEMRQTLRLIENIINQMDNIHRVANSLSKQLHENIKQVLQPYLDNVNEDFSGRGQTLRNLSDTISKSDGADFRSTDGGGNDYEAVPNWVLMFEWICFVLIILIIIILLLALIKICCGKRWKGEQDARRKRKCYSQETGSCLFQLSVYMMCLLFILALLPIWWNFEHGVGVYNGRCKKSNDGGRRYAKSIGKQKMDTQLLSRVERDNGGRYNNLIKNKIIYDFKSNLANEITEDDMGYINSECRNGKVELFLASNATNANYMPVPPNLSELAEKILNNTVNIAQAMKKLKKSARFADESTMKELCNNFKTQLDKSKLIELYDTINSFVSNQMVDTEKNEKRFSHCNLYAFKKNLIDDFDNHKVANLMKSINNQCNSIDKFFDGGFRKYTTSCLSEVQKIEKSHKENINGILDDATKNLHKHFTEELDNYKSFVINEFGTEERGTIKEDSCMGYAYDKNGVWIPLLLILLLFLPLNPIAIYLSRLYHCLAIRPLQQPCCVEERLYNAIKYRLHKRADGFQRQASKHHKPPRSCSCNEVIKTKKQYRCNVPVFEARDLAEAQSIDEVKPNMETSLAEVSPAAIAHAGPCTSTIVDEESSSQPCRGIKFKVKLRFITSKKH